MKYKCSVCGYIYDPRRATRFGRETRTPFASLPKAGPAGLRASKKDFIALVSRCPGTCW